MNTLASKQRLIHKDVHFSVFIIVIKGNPQCPFAKKCLKLSIPLKEEFCVPSHHLWSSYDLTPRPCSILLSHSFLLNSIPNTVSSLLFLKAYMISPQSLTICHFLCLLIWTPISHVSAQYQLQQRPGHPTKTAIPTPSRCPLTLLDVFLYS